MVEACCNLFNVQVWNSDVELYWLDVFLGKGAGQLIPVEPAEEKFPVFGIQKNRVILASCDHVDRQSEGDQPRLALGPLPAEGSALPTAPRVDLPTRQQSQ